MYSELQNLADSKNVALILSLIANVWFGWRLNKYIQKREAGIDAREQIYLGLLKRQLEDEPDAEMAPDSLDKS